MIRGVPRRVTANFWVILLCLTSPVRPDNYDLVWSDEFDGEDGSPVDSAKWNHEEWGPGSVNNELQAYTSRLENSRQENGTLIIECRRDNYTGYEFTSARLFTKVGWTYGRFEARIRFPTGLATWPAFWLFPQNPFLYATTCDNETGWIDGCDAWPNSGEIDIVEFVGFQPGIIHGSAHTNTHNFLRGMHHVGTLEVPTASEEFHVYSVEWQADRIDYFVDGEKYFTVYRQTDGWQNFPFDHDFHIVLNLAYGGNWGGQGGFDISIFDREEGVRLEVDYVRVYAPPELTYIMIPGKIEAGNYVDRYFIPSEIRAGEALGLVGPLFANDWLAYHVEITAKGNYTFTYGVSGSDTGAFLLVWENEVIDSVMVPSLRTFTTVESTRTVAMEQGRGILRLQVTSSSFTLNFVEVLKASGQVQETVHSAPSATSFGSPRSRSWLTILSILLFTFRILG